MDPATLKPLLLTCLALAYAILLVWWAALAFAHDALHALHARWFRIPRETFDAIHYAAMAFFKLGALLLFGLPWLALVLAK
jgi:hypothetical protein